MIQSPQDIPEAFQVELLLKLFKRAILQENGCRLWTGSQVDGYGTFKFKGHTHKAHRLIGFLVVDGWFKGAIIRHSCDTKLCIEPDHLLWGTRQENILDVVANGGNTKTRNRGDLNGMAKLNDELALKIKERLKTGVPQRYIAAEFNVSQALISKINTGDRWDWV